MLTNQVDAQPTQEKAELRARTASTKVTEAEFAEMESFATQRGQSLSEWIRQTILNEARNRRDSASTAHLFTELVGIQLLLMNTLGPLLRGEKVSSEQLDSILKQVQSTKTRKAQELLNKRLQGEERKA